MPTAFEVPANELINRLAKHLKENVSEISPPPWSEYAKTGAHKERPPQDPDWWFARCASLLRKIYVHGPVGVSRLRVQYGGNVGRGDSPEHHGRAGGSAKEDLGPTPRSEERDQDQESLAMARHKPSGKKKHLSHGLKQAQPVPSWVVEKTSGKVRRTPKQRHWRKTKIKV